GRDDLARGAVAAKRQAEEMSSLIAEDLKAIDDVLAKTNDDLLKLQNKLKEAKAKQRSMEIRHVSATDRVRINRQIHDGRIDDALARYEHWERKIEEVEAEAESFVMGSNGSPRQKTLVDEFKELESEDDINAELEALRQRVAARTGQPTN
ncbi:MAG: phage shock protein PspA, partial [Pseudomonadota bacterium]